MYFRHARTSDAERILELRRAPVAAGLLSESSDDPAVQRRWLVAYRERHAAGVEHYFMVCTHAQHALGTVRVHDITASSCWWGSWIIAPQSSVATVLESYLLVNYFIFGMLRLEEARLSARAANQAVVRFHDAMKSPRVGCTELDILYHVDSGWYADLKGRYARYFARINVP